MYQCIVTNRVDYTTVHYLVHTTCYTLQTRCHFSQSCPHLSNIDHNVPCLYRSCNKCSLVPRLLNLYKTLRRAPGGWGYSKCLTSIAIFLSLATSVRASAREGGSKVQHSCQEASSCPSQEILPWLRATAEGQAAAKENKGGADIQEDFWGRSWASEREDQRAEEICQGEAGAACQDSPGPAGLHGKLVSCLLIISIHVHVW